MRDIEINMLKNINDSRKQQLKELKSFTDTVNEEITNIVETLGWSVDSITNVDKEYFTCPYDSSHRLTEGSLNDHLVSCQWKAEGYGKLDVPLSEPTLLEDSPFCIKFDEQLQEQILRNAKDQNSAMQTGMGKRLVPRTSDRIVIDFTSDEKKALYDYVIANTAKPDNGEDITNINNLEPQEKADKELSFLELLIQERNLKRRRAKHKGVHTNKRSYIEILREVINQQMEVFVDYISGQSNSGHDVRNTETDNLNYEQIQDGTDRLYKIFHSSSHNSDEYNSKERNGHHHKKKREHSEERNYHRLRDRDKQKRYSDETDRKHKHEYKNTESSSYSRERKSHKKDKYRSKNKHKDKYHEKKHKSEDRDKSSERHYSKHSDHKRARKNKSKEY
ncbi:PREDICTED: U11/U12 small nuclear ribonucleoprotein 48 kDa protein-like [Cyphomyrmex costatus]|uniref:U11/U12 small nuclear ribonucleoprotein 48 kDa protein-like n=1 Tax=Cyphomyrmex costatus TaxID=456900 RepID=UPI0008522B1E|nr:PREDICTED: U11/U12 small nuclear ribonucleoprotein 48 kDa protein-like [Cyphomyrmex costatus]